MRLKKLKSWEFANWSQLPEVIKFWLDSTLPCKRRKKMKLTLKRRVFTGDSTVGDLYVDKEFFCHTLEDTIRDHKIDGETAIPRGDYKVTLSYSPKFKRTLPLVNEVPGFTGIRFHAGNSKKDTEGCILVGYEAGKDWVGDSRAALEDLLVMLEEAKGEIWLEVC